MDDVLQNLTIFMKDFVITEAQQSAIYRMFCQNLAKGLRVTTNKNTDIKCYLTYVQDSLTGEERGKYLSMSLMSNGVTILLCELMGDSEDITTQKTYEVPKAVQVGTGRQLFDFVASCLEKFVKEFELINELLALGLSIGFPCLHEGMEKAYLQRWTKGFRCAGVINNEIGLLLKEAIARRDGLQIDVVTIVNNSTNTFVNCCYKNPLCRIALNIRDGFNATYMERTENTELLEDEYKDKEHILINTECGAFGEHGSLDFIKTIFDIRMDMKTNYPGMQVLEKLVGAQYLSNLLKLLLHRAMQLNHIFKDEENKQKIMNIVIAQNNNCTSIDYMNKINNDETVEYEYCRSYLHDILHVTNPSNDDCIKIRFICSTLFKRAAVLTGICVSALINKINEAKIVVGIGGNMYGHNHNFDAFLKATMNKLVHPSVEYDLVLTDDTLGVGTVLLTANTSTKKFMKSFDIINDGLIRLIRHFMLTDMQQRLLLKSLNQELAYSLAKKSFRKAEIKCTPTFVQQMLTGRERGKFLSLHFYGACFRVILVILGEQNKITQESQIFRIYDDIKLGSGENLFSYIAKSLMFFVNKHHIKDETLPLCFTICFPSVHVSIKNAILVNWTEGLKCTDVENQDVGDLLQTALAAYSEAKIDVVAVINETTGLLYSCLYHYDACRIGIRMGTECTACYMERIENFELVDDEYKNRKHMLINCEWNTFGDKGALEYIRTEFDRELDNSSSNKGSDLYSKMIGGAYLGKLVRILLRRAVEENLIFENVSGKNNLLYILRQNEDCIQTAHMLQIQSDNLNEMSYTMNFLYETFNLKYVNIEECLKVKFLCDVVSKRAATLIGVGISSLISKVNESKVIVAIDGYVFEYNPKCKIHLLDTIQKFVRASVEYDLVLTKNGATFGAAMIAASIAQKD